MPRVPRKDLEHLRRSAKKHGLLLRDVKKEYLRIRKELQQIHPDNETKRTEHALSVLDIQIVFRGLKK